jgi:hypothetical protein
MNGATDKLNYEKNYLKIMVLTEEERRARKKAADKRYNLKPERKAKQKKRNEKPERKLFAKNYRDSTRLKVLQYYSKSLSNSNIPCCRCCGLNSHVDFLDIDHITGRKQMDFDSELVKIEYSSKLHDALLHKWIIGNNFPDGFQILCKNCNHAKSVPKNNNKCPHEMK